MWSLERWRAGLNRAEFDCGEELLNLWLREHAGQSERRDTARTFVAVGNGDVIVGYFSLVAGQLAADESGIEPLDSRYPIPCVRLARLAVDLKFQGTGVGSLLLGEAVRLSSEVLERAAMQVLVVEALNLDAVAFYARWGFRRFRDDPLRLYLTSQDIRASIRAAGE